MTTDFTMLSSLNAEEAKQIARYKCKTLRLDGLKTLEPDAAWELARYRGDLHLDGITALSGDVAKALSLHEGGCLSLNGLTQLQPDVAGALAPFKNQLLLNGISHISDETCQALARRACGLSLNGLTSLSPKALRTLAQPEEWATTVAGPAPLPDYARDRLSRLKAKVLALDGLVELSPDAERALSLHCGPLSLAKLASLNTFELAHALKYVNEGNVRCSDMHLSDSAIAGLAADVDPDHNEWIKDFDLELDCVRELSPALAAELVGFNGYSLQLNKLTHVSDEVAGILGTCEVWHLHLDGLTTLTEKAAAGLAARTGELFLSGLKSVDAAAAKALAKCKGNVCLYGLESLSDPDLASKLAEDRDFELPELIHLSDEAAKALVVALPEIRFDKLPTLTVGGARAFASSRGWVDLTGLYEVSDECAVILAGFKGERLNLSRPVMLSVRAEETLRANPRVRIHGAGPRQSQPGQNLVINTHCWAESNIDHRYGIADGSLRAFNGLSELIPPEAVFTKTVAEGGTFYGYVLGGLPNDDSWFTFPELFLGNASVPVEFFAAGCCEGPTGDSGWLTVAIRTGKRALWLRAVLGNFVLGSRGMNEARTIFADAMRRWQAGDELVVAGAFVERLPEPLPSPLFTDRIINRKPESWPNVGH
jgi:hypothetical protein